MIKGSKCLVTGGGGTIGSTVVDQLVAAGAGEVTVLDNFVRGRRENLADALESGQVRLVEGDIRDRSLVGELMAGTDLVFHLAAIRITQCATEPRLALEVLVDGTYEIVEAAAEAGVRKVIASSSASVYGLATSVPDPGRSAPIRQRHALRCGQDLQRGPAAAFPRHAGLGLRRRCVTSTCTARGWTSTALYTEVLIRWMERIEAGQPPLIFGDGTQTMDFVFTEDIARANLLAAESDATDEVFNIGSGIETSLRELADALLRGDGQRPAARVWPGHGPSTGVTRRLADVSLADKCLGWQPRLAWKKGCGGWSTWWRAERMADCGRDSGGLIVTIPVMRPWIGDEEAAAAAAAVASGWVAQGPRVAQFEQEFAAAIGSGHGWRCPPARRRLHLALIAAGVGAGRRGGCPFPIVHRHGQRGPVCRRASSVRRCGCRHAEPHTGDRRAGPHRSHACGNSRGPGRSPRRP